MILPAIIARNLPDLQNKIRLTESFPGCKWAHIDVMDGIFVPAKTVLLSSLASIKTRLSLELHCMIQNPERHSNLLFCNARRIILHQESTSQNNLLELFQKIKTAKIQTGLALNPSTPIRNAMLFSPTIDILLLMSVNPGAYGSLFHPSVYQKIRASKQRYPKIPIAIDGGVSADNIKYLQATGVTNFCVGSRIFQTPDPKASYLSLANTLNNKMSHLK